MKKTSFLLMTTALAAVLLSSACAPVDNGTFDGNSNGISEPASSDPKESSLDSNQTSVPVSSSAEESSNKSEDSKPESSDNSENNSSTSYFAYHLIAVSSEDVRDYLTEDSMGFYFTYIRYQKPVFYNTLDDPNLIDWNTGDPKNPLVNIGDPDYLRVKIGDKLENGLTVKSAESLFTRNAGELTLNMIEFEGELTLEGILYCDSTGDRGKLYFFADAAKSDPIPLIRTEEEPHIPDRTCSFISNTDKFAVCADGAGIELGLLNESPIDLSGIISPGECIRAKITVSNLIHRYSDFNESFRRATLVSLEKLPD